MEDAIRLALMSDLERETGGPSVKRRRLDPDSVLDDLLAAYKRPDLVQQLSPPYLDVKRLVLDDDVISVFSKGKFWLNTKLLIFILNMCPALEVLHLFTSEAYVFKLSHRQVYKIFDAMPPLKDFRSECLQFTNDVFHSIRKIKSLETLSLYVPMDAFLMKMDCEDFVDNLLNLRFLILGSKWGHFVINSHQIQNVRAARVSLNFEF